MKALLVLILLPISIPANVPEGTLDNPHLTESFRLKDFQPTCKSDVIPKKYIENLCLLAENLQIIQDHIKKPIKIISGYRSPRCNKRVGGAKKSQHMVGKAADIRVKRMRTRTLKKIIESLIRDKKIQQGGLGLYSWHVHYDVRGNRARWRKTKYSRGICK